MKGLDLSCQLFYGARPLPWIESGMSCLAFDLKLENSNALSKRLDLAIGGQRWLEYEHRSRTSGLIFNDATG